MKKILDILEKNDRYKGHAKEIAIVLRNNGFNETNIGNLPRLGRLLAGVDVYPLVEYIQAGLAADAAKQKSPEPPSETTSESAASAPPKSPAESGNKKK